VLYITERCVPRLGDSGLELIEIAPGVDLERDVLARMGFRREIAPDLREMDAAIFTDAPLGLAERSPLTLDERVDYRADDALLRRKLGRAFANARLEQTIDRDITCRARR
jgi:propionate CoA-transferase